MEVMREPLASGSRGMVISTESGRECLLPDSFWEREPRPHAAEARPPVQRVGQCA